MHKKTTKHKKQSKTPQTHVINLKIIHATLTAADSEDFLLKEHWTKSTAAAVLPVICHPHTKTMISKQRCPDAPRSPTSFDAACHPLRLVNAHKSTLVSQKITSRWHAADGGNTPLHLPACCSLTGKKTVMSLGGRVYKQLCSPVPARMLDWW